MDSLPLIWILPIITFVLFVAAALWSRKKTNDLDHRSESERSTLAKDGPGPNPVGPDR